MSLNESLRRSKVFQGNKYYECTSAATLSASHFLSHLLSLSLSLSLLSISSFLFQNFHYISHNVLPSALSKYCTNLAAEWSFDLSLPAADTLPGAPSSGMASCIMPPRQTTDWLAGSSSLRRCYDDRNY